MKARASIGLGIRFANARALPQRVLVVGLARSGRAASLTLRAHGVAVVAYDVSDEIDVDDLRAAGAVVALGGDGTDLLEGVGLLVKSPGVPTDAPLVVAAARRHGIPIVSEVELAAQLLANPLLGITGTNGKTTTTALLGAMFTAAGVPAEVAGNIGRPLIELVGEVAESTVGRRRALVVPTRGHRRSLRPRIAVLLNLEPDHLDRVHAELRGLSYGEAPHLREPGARRCRDRAGRVRPDAG